MNISTKLCVCLSFKISITTERIEFFILGKLYAGHGIVKKLSKLTEQNVEY